MYRSTTYSPRRVLPGLLLPVILQCGVYTFSGSSLPGHLKTVDIPLFVNESQEPEIAEALTDRINREVLSTDLLRIVSSSGDATINGTVVRYSHEPHTFGRAGVREVDVSEYIVKVTVDILFKDNKKDKAIYEGRIVGEGIYDFADEEEEAGKRRALDHAADQIIQNSVQSW